MSLFAAMSRRKSDTDDSPKESLKKCLTLWNLIVIGVGATIGAGVYILAGEVARQKAGPGVTLSFIVAAIISVLSGICYAELGCRVPKAGSGYAYLYVSIGEFAAFSIGWLLVLSYVIGTSSVASALTKNIEELSGGWVNTHINVFSGIPGDFFRDNLDILSVFIIIALCALMCYGVEEASRVTGICLYRLGCSLI